MNLREAIEQGNLKKFISEHKGDKAAFDTTLDSMAGKSKATREASSRDGSDD